MSLLKTVKDIIVDNIFEQRDAELRILKKTFRGDVEKLYLYLKSRNMIDDFVEDIMTDDDDETRELHRMFIDSFIKTGDTERLYKYTLPVFNDLTLDGDVVTFTLDDKEDIAQFFYKDRDMSIDYIKSLLMGETDPYHYYEDFDRQTLEYLIDDLDEQNINHLKDIIKNTCLGKKVDYRGNNEILEDVIESDGGLITKDGLEEIYKSDDSMADFIFYTDEMSNTKDNLSRISSYGNEQAMHDENYDNLYSAIEDFFGDKGEEFDTGRKYKKQGMNGNEYTYTDYDYKLDVTSLYEDVIKWWLDADYNDLDYWGSFEAMLEEYCGDLSYGDSLSFRHSEYPDSGRFKQIVNEIFFDYIDD